MTSTARRIADEARAILAAEGSAAVSMRRVATAVGITPMAIYRHYPDRDALLDALAGELFDELGAAWSVEREPEAFDTAVAEAIDAYLDFALREPRLHAFLFTEPRAGARRFPTDFAGASSPTLAVLTGLLDAGVAAGRLREHPRMERALLIAAQLHGLVQLYHGGRIALPEPRLRALCHQGIEELLDGIRR